MLGFSILKMIKIIKGFNHEKICQEHFKLLCNLYRDPL